MTTTTTSSSCPRVLHRRRSFPERRRAAKTSRTMTSFSPRDLLRRSLQVSASSLPTPFPSLTHLLYVQSTLLSRPVLLHSLINNFPTPASLLPASTQTSPRQASTRTSLLPTSIPTSFLLQRSSAADVRLTTTSPTTSSADPTTRTRPRLQTSSLRTPAVLISSSDLPEGQEDLEETSVLPRRWHRTRSRTSLIRPTKATNSRVGWVLLLPPSLRTPTLFPSDLPPATARSIRDLPLPQVPPRPRPSPPVLSFATSARSLLRSSPRRSSGRQRSLSHQVQQVESTPLLGRKESRTRRQGSRRSETSCPRSRRSR
jgi:hypothetical protein